MNSVADVAVHAEKLGYNYNQVLNMMERDQILPFYERKSLEVYKGIGNSYGWCDELCEIFDSYVDTYGKQELSD